MSFKGAITDNATNFMVPDDLNRMVKDLNMTVKEDELKALFNRIHSYGTDPADKVSVGTFVKYANAVFDSIKKSKESGVNLRGIAGPAIKKYLIYERILPEDYFKRYKLRSKDCLLFHEFTKMIQDLQLAIEPSNEEINKLFQFLNKEKEDEMLTYQEFLDIFNDPADVVNQINKSKHESLLLEVKVKIFYKDSLQNKRW
jgi:Ca2+-binding EF-hand superfamily protein